MAAFLIINYLEQFLWLLFTSKLAHPTGRLNKLRNIPITTMFGHFILPVLVLELRAGQLYIIPLAKYPTILPVMHVSCQ